MVFMTSKKLYARFEKARKKQKSDRGFRGRVKKFILERLSKKEIAEKG
jgi:hypothetical protein